MQKFLVMRQEYEYNDEYYEVEGQEPVMSFDDLRCAEDYALELTIKDISDSTIADLNEYLSDGVIANVMKGETFTRSDKVSELPLHAVRRLAKKLDFYSVMPIPHNEPSPVSLSSQQTLKQIAAKMQDGMAQLREAMKTEFYQSVKELFVRLPTLAAFGWRQYTPYFNDGEECVFHMGEVSILLHNEDNEDWLDNGFYYRETEQGHLAINDAVNEFVNSVPSAEYKHLFGDHVKVIVTKGGIEVTEYTDHY